MGWTRGAVHGARGLRADDRAGLGPSATGVAASSSAIGILRGGATARGVAASIRGRGADFGAASRAVVSYCVAVVRGRAADRAPAANARGSAVRVFSAVRACRCRALEFVAGAFFELPPPQISLYVASIPWSCVLRSV